MSPHDDDLSEFADDPILRALTGPASPAELAGEAEMLAAFRAAVPVRTKRKYVGRLSVGVVGSAAGVAVALSGGVAAAYTASLPAPVQRIAHAIGRDVGVPAGHHHSSNASGQNGGSPSGSATQSPTATPTTSSPTAPTVTKTPRPVVSKAPTHSAKPSTSSSPKPHHPKASTGSSSPHASSSSPSTATSSPPSSPTATPTLSPSPTLTPSPSITPTTPPPSQSISPLPTPSETYSVAPPATLSPSASPTTPASITISVSSTKVAPGAPVTVIGHLATTRGTPVKHHKLYLIEHIAGRSDTTRVAVGRTDSHGSAQFSTPPIEQKLKLRLSTESGVHSAVQSVRVAPTISETVTPNGASYAVTVAVAGGNPGDYLELQEHMDGRWSDIGGGALNPSSGAMFSVPAPAKGVVHYRLQLGSTTLHSAAVGKFEISAN